MALPVDKLGKKYDEHTSTLDPDRVKAYAAATNDPIAAHLAGDVGSPVFAIVPVFDSLLEPALEVGPLSLIGKVLHDVLDIAPDNPFRLAYMISKNNGEPIAFTGYSEVFAAWVDVRGYPHPDGYTILFRAASPDRPVAGRTVESERERDAARSINQRIFDTSLDLILVVNRRGSFLRSPVIC